MIIVDQEYSCFVTKVVQTLSCCEESSTFSRVIFSHPLGPSEPNPCMFADPDPKFQITRPKCLTILITTAYDRIKNEIKLVLKME